MADEELLDHDVYMKLLNRLISVIEMQARALCSRENPALVVESDGTEDQLIDIEHEEYMIKLVNTLLGVIETQARVIKSMRNPSCVVKDDK